jgi:hypothetical protein
MPASCEICHKASVCSRCTTSDFTDEGEGEEGLWFVLKKSDAVELVREIENGNTYKSVEVLKQQPWWPDLSSRVRLM